MAQADLATVDKYFFYTKLNEFYSDQINKQKKPWSLQRHSEVIQIIIASKQASAKKVKRTNEQYYFGNHYDIIEVAGVKKVVRKRKKENDSLIFLVPYENIYDELLVCHRTTGHGGRDKMKTALSNTLHIHRTCIEIFLKCCKRCTEKKSQSIKAVVALSKNWNHKGHVDIIDLRTTPDGEYKWLLHYQDLATKFIHLRPLKGKLAEEVSLELLKIFLIFGAPQILQGDYSFVNAIIKDLALKWPSCKIINGRTFEDGTTQDVEGMLRCWLKDNDTENWSLGCFYVQSAKNSSYHGVIGRSPYKALFGVDFKVGLNSTNLPSEEEVNRTAYAQELPNDSSSINEYEVIKVKQEFSEAEYNSVDGIDDDLLKYDEDNCIKDESIKISEVKVEFVDPDNIDNYYERPNIKSEESIFEIPTSKSVDVINEAARNTHLSSEQQIYEESNRNICNEEPHIRRYKKGNQLKCKICNYNCNSNSTLNKHMLKHSGEKTLKCNTQLAFQGLKKHKLIHCGGRKPIKCDI